VISPWRTYVVTARVAQPLPGVFWDTANPYHYLRTWDGPDGTVVIVGGEDHRVGAEMDTESRYRRLASWMEPRLAARVDRCWSGQVNEPADGLPLIGRNPFSMHLYVATGFSGTGLVNGTLAAMILAEALQGRAHPLARLLAARRVKPLAQLKEALVHNVETARWMIGDRIAPQGEVRSLDEVPRGEGRIVRFGRERIAVHRTDDGQLRALSPVCTHLGCYVHWNAGERSWDCPCHGSRYDVDGQVIHGPAVKPLARRELPAEVVRPPRAAEPVASPPLAAPPPMQPYDEHPS
jgi:Rieske Fe-S protein